MNEFTKIVIRETFPVPVEKVFQTMLDHNKMSEWLGKGIQIQRVKDSVDSYRPNGVGSVRRFRPLGLSLGAFEETVISISENKKITYKITKGSPIREHEGNIHLNTIVKQNSHRTSVIWEIVLVGKFPFVAEILKPILYFAISKGLKKLKTTLVGSIQS